MKLVVAIIQPSKLDTVRESLIAGGITRITVNRVTGHGQGQKLDLYRGVAVVHELTPKVRLEIAVNDDFLDATLDIILTSGREGEGESGDGKIFVLDLVECIRMRTGERGPSAI